MALNNIPPLTLSIPGLFEFSFIGNVPSYYLVLVAAIAYVVIARLVYSRVGRAMIALRENVPLATASSRRSRAGGVAAVVRSPGPRKQRTPAQDRLRNEGNSSRGALGRSIVNPFWRGIRRREHDV